MNILFDEGSQKSFLTEKLTTMLFVTPHQSENINLSSFGSSQPLYGWMDNVILHIKTRSGELVPVSALVVPAIVAPLANITNASISKLSGLNGLRLAHPISREENFEISVLVGDGSYWNLVGDHIVTGDSPTAVSSKLGYLLSGPLPEPQPTCSSQCCHQPTQHCGEP